MKIFSLTALAFLAFTTLCAAQDVKAPDFGTLTVQGTGRIEAVPDQAEIAMGVETQGNQVAEAMQANAAAMRAMLEEAVRSGIDKRDMRTSTLSLQPVYTSADSGRSAPRISGYRATNTVTLKVRDISKLGDVISAVTKNGANQISSLNFLISNEETKRQEARIKAVQDAKAKAELFAKEAGMRLGMVQEISEDGSVPVFMGKSEHRAMAASVPIEPGVQGIDAQVRMVWRLLP
jgi:uncharacterized protein